MLRIYLYIYIFNVYALSIILNKSNYIQSIEFGLNHINRLTVAHVHVYPVDIHYFKRKIQSVIGDKKSF